MQDSSPPPASQADRQQLLARIDRLESLLRGHQEALGRQMGALQERLARFGFETMQQVADAAGSLDTNPPEAPQRPCPPATSAQPTPRATAYRRMGRMV